MKETEYALLGMGVLARAGKGVVPLAWRGDPAPPDDGCGRRSILENTSLIRHLDKPARPATAPGRPPERRSRRPR